MLEIYLKIDIIRIRIVLKKYMTNKQRELLEIIKQEHKHLTAEEIFILAKNKGFNISLASVYRILNVLVENNELQKIANIYKQDTFDIWVDEHEHLVCSKCGKITDIKIKDFKQLLVEKINVDIDSFDLCIHYVCEECKNK